MLMLILILAVGPLLGLKRSIMNKRGLHFLFWIRDVFRTQRIRVLGCKTHLESRILALCEHPKACNVPSCVLLACAVQ